MERPLSALDFSTPTTATTDNMGHAYRTPSPTRESYISSSNVNSPQTTPQAYSIRSYEYASYQQRIRTHASGFAALESDKQHQRNTVALSHLPNVFAVGGDCTDQTADDDTATPDSRPFREPTLVQEPHTPTKKRVPVLWHGLPSPETPTIHDHTQSTPLADSAQKELGQQISEQRTKDANGIASTREGDTIARSFVPKQHGIETDNAHIDDVKIAIPQTQNDATLAHEIESLSPTKTRRSTRLQTQRKPTYTIQVPVAAPKVDRKLPLSPVASDHDAQSELSIAPTKADLIAFEGLPIVHSLSWQLQYPAGGSTHPSYPYPVMDPRLLFDQAFVPITGGLPDVTLVPKLVLPMGWKHVSWSGLLPIAFDPYRQAFKLSPVGPMPLTCEELHQQGLHKYVPLGELHPEYGMLPEMLKLSDGSDATVFDFDGVDWTLPWEGQIDFHASCRIMDKHYGSDETSSPKDTNNFVSMVTYPWNEARDCPNKVFDISDAWRWLSNKETNPTADFIPTLEKRWHGSGAFRSARKLKSPIPELMMLSIQPTPTNPDMEPNPVLQNQDPAKGRNEFCPYKSVATSSTVDVTLLGDTEFTIMELLSYFPQHYCWGHAAERLARAGVMPTVIRDVIIMTRGLQGGEIKMAGSIAATAMVARKRDCVKAEKLEEMDIDKVDQDSPAPTSTLRCESAVADITAGYTAEGWRYDVWEKIDYPLLALAHGLQSLPTGPDAGPLTTLILWCKEKGRYRALLSEVPTLLREAEIEPLIEPGENGCPDRDVAGRYAEALKKDRLRVVRDAGINKRAFDGSVSDAHGKRRKVG